MNDISTTRYVIIWTKHFIDYWDNKSLKFKQDMNIYGKYTVVEKGFVAFKNDINMLLF